MSHPTLVMSPALYCGAVEEEVTKALGVEAGQRNQNAKN